MSSEKHGDISAVPAGGPARDLDSRHPIHEASYKGWLIRYWNRGEWTAQLFEPGSPEPLADRVVASLDEGEAMLIQRAQRKIDAAVDP
jgi:hypothetical protein